MWVVPVAITFGVLGLIDGIVFIFLIAVNAKYKILKFFMDILFALGSLFYVFVVIAILYKILVEYLRV